MAYVGINNSQCLDKDLSVHSYSYLKLRFPGNWVYFRTWNFNGVEIQMGKRFNVWTFSMRPQLRYSIVVKIPLHIRHQTQNTHQNLSLTSRFPLPAIPL